MKKEFDIKYRPQIESGEYKVATESNLPVEILRWEEGGGYPIVAIIKLHDGSVEPCLFDKRGNRFNRVSNSVYNIYILTPEPELTEFEEAIQGLMNGVNNGFTLNIKEEASILLDIARKEILKDMPKWKRSVTDIAQYEDECIIYENRARTDFSRSVPILKCGLMQVDIEELKKKLPKEE